MQRSPLFPPQSTSLHGHSARLAQSFHQRSTFNVQLVQEVQGCDWGHLSANWRWSSLHLNPTLPGWCANPTLGPVHTLEQCLITMSLPQPSQAALYSQKAGIWIGASEPGLWDDLVFPVGLWQSLSEVKCMYSKWYAVRVTYWSSRYRLRFITWMLWWGI